MEDYLISATLLYSILVQETTRFTAPFILQPNKAQ